MTYYDVIISDAKFVAKSTNMDSLIKACDWAKQKFEAELITNDPNCDECFGGKSYCRPYAKGFNALNHDFSLTTELALELSKLLALSWNLRDDLSGPTDLPIEDVIRDITGHQNRTFTLSLFEI